MREAIQELNETHKALAEIQKQFKITLGVFAVYDRKVNQYLPPMFVPHDGLAERWFGEQVQTTNQIGKYPTEHELYKLGTFEPDTGKFINLEKPLMIMNGGQIKRELKIQAQQENQD